MTTNLSSDAPVLVSDPKRRRTARARRVLHPEALSSLEEYRSVGGLRGLEVALGLRPGEIVSTMLDAGLRGRGGAGFPAGRKWATVAGNASGGSPRR